MDDTWQARELLVRQYILDAVKVGDMDTIRRLKDFYFEFDVLDLTKQCLLVLFMDKHLCYQPSVHDPSHTRKGAFAR